MSTAKRKQTNLSLIDAHKKINKTKKYDSKRQRCMALQQKKQQTNNNKHIAPFVYIFYFM